MGRKPYVRVSEEEKAKALKRHLVEKVPVSTICEELQIAPNLFYTWQQRLFEEAGSVLSGTRKKKGQATASDTQDRERVVMLEARLRQREEALSELMTEYVALKKRSTGEV